MLAAGKHGSLRHKASRKLVHTAASLWRIGDDLMTNKYGGAYSANIAGDYTWC